MSATLRRDARAVAGALARLVRVYQFRDRDRIVGCHGISVTQCYALETVVRDGPTTLRDLAAALRLDKSTASRTVGALLRKQLLARRADPGDRRALRLAATPAGRALHRRIERGLHAEAESIVADLDPEVRRGAVTVLDRITDAAARRSGAESR